MSRKNKDELVQARISKEEKDRFINKVGQKEVAYVIRKFIRAFNKDLVDFKPDNK